MIVSRISNVTELHVTGYTIYITELLQLFHNKPLKKLCVYYPPGAHDVIPGVKAPAPLILRNLTDLHVDLLPDTFSMLLFHAFPEQCFPTLSNLTFHGSARRMFEHPDRDWNTLRCASRSVKQLSMDVNSEMSPLHLFTDLLVTFPALQSLELHLGIASGREYSKYNPWLERGKSKGFKHPAVVEVIGRIPRIRFVCECRTARRLLLDTLSALAKARVQLSCLELEVVKPPDELYAYDPKTQGNVPGGLQIVDLENEIRSSHVGWLASNVETFCFRRYERHLYLCQSGISLTV